MFVYPGDVIPVDEWERMKAEAYDRCMAERSDAGLAPMVEATGIDWFEPGIPDKLPPTPGERVGGYMHAVNQLPRRLRRHAQRILHCDDVCGAMEVMGYLSDAELEANITGEDCSTTYLEYLYEIPYAIPVLRFIAAVHDWLTGLDRFEFDSRVGDGALRPRPHRRLTRDVPGPAPSGYTPAAAAAQAAAVYHCRRPTRSLRAAQRPRPARDRLTRAAVLDEEDRRPVRGCRLGDALFVSVGVVEGGDDMHRLKRALEIVALVATILSPIITVALTCHWF